MIGLAKAQIEINKLNRISYLVIIEIVIIIYKLNIIYEHEFKNYCESC